MFIVKYCLHVFYFVYVHQKRWTSESESGVRTNKIVREYVWDFPICLILVFGENDSEFGSTIFLGWWFIFTFGGRVYSASLLRRTRAAKAVWPKHNPPHLAVCVFYVYLSRIFQCIFRSWHCDSEIWVKNCTGVLVYVMLDVPNFPLKKKSIMYGNYWFKKRSFQHMFQHVSTLQQHAATWNSRFFCQQIDVPACHSI